MGAEGFEEEAYVGGDGFRRSSLFDVVGSDEEDDADRVEVEDVFAEADKDAAGSVAADSAVGDLEGAEAVGGAIAPAFGDGVADEDEGMAVEFTAFRPFLTALEPVVFEPISAADGAGSGKTVVRGGDAEVGGRLGDGDARGDGEDEWKDSTEERHGMWEEVCGVRGWIQSLNACGRAKVASRSGG
jgi:hypothetical protein